MGATEVHPVRSVPDMLHGVIWDVQLAQAAVCTISNPENVGCHAAMSCSCVPFKSSSSRLTVAMNPASTPLES